MSPAPEAGDIRLTFLINERRSEDERVMLLPCDLNRSGKAEKPSAKGNLDIKSDRRINE